MFNEKSINLLTNQPLDIKKKTLICIGIQKNITNYLVIVNCRFIILVACHICDLFFFFESKELFESKKHLQIILCFLF